MRITQSHIDYYRAKIRPVEPKFIRDYYTAREKKFRIGPPSSSPVCDVHRLINCQPGAEDPIVRKFQGISSGLDAWLRRDIARGVDVREALAERCVNYETGPQRWKIARRWLRRLNAERLKAQQREEVEALFGSEV